MKYFTTFATYKQKTNKCMKNLSLKTLALGILALFAVTTISAQEEPAKKKNKFGLANRGSYNIVVFLTICISYANNCFTL